MVLVALLVLAGFGLACVLGYIAVAWWTIRQMEQARSAPVEAELVLGGKDDDED